ncbi:MAG TPA: ferredoxin-type protein NapF [Azospira sp.]|nr:ferredoxin-type protein NapF [Azospira sp.]
MSIPIANLARRNFFRVRSGSAPAPLRPPWALAEAEFLAACTGCGDCETVCPTGILTVAGPKLPPTVDFRQGECTFCGQCASACRPRALMREDDREPWPYKAQAGMECLAQRQVECRSCGDFCPEGALRFPPRAGGPALPVLLLERCTGCGACLAPCPSGAIHILAPV